MNLTADQITRLQGIGVLVTRPAQQAEGLCRLLETYGATAIRFPTLTILDPRDSAAIFKVIDCIDDYDMAIFTSANAVNRAIPLIQSRHGLPPGLLRVAIGKASARELARLGVPAQLVPDTRFNSEALLAMPRMRTVAGQRVVIFRGEGGRELLGDTLKERGAQVTYAEVYRRGKPAVDSSELIQRWALGEIHAVIVTSNESLTNLFEMIGPPGQQWLRNTPLIVVSTRARPLAQRLGFKHPPLVSREVSDEAIVETLFKLASNPIRMTVEDPQ